MIKIVGKSGAIPPTMTVLELQGRLEVPETLLAEGGAVPIGHISSNAQFPTQRTLHVGTVAVDGSYKTHRQPLLVLRRVTGEEAEPDEQQQLSSASSVADNADEDQVEEAEEDDVKKALVDEDDVDEAFRRAAMETREGAIDDGGTGCGTELFETWINAHPEQLELDYHYGEGSSIHSSRLRRKRGRSPRGPEEDGEPEEDIKTYEWVGVVPDYCLFNSKPARKLR